MLQLCPSKSSGPQIVVSMFFPQWLKHDTTASCVITLRSDIVQIQELNQTLDERMQLIHPSTSMEGQFSLLITVKDVCFDYIYMFNGFCSTWTLLLSIHFALLVVLLFEIIVCFGSDWCIDWQWEGLTSLMPHQALLAIQIHYQLSWKDWKPQDEQVWGARRVFGPSHHQTITAQVVSGHTKLRAQVVQANKSQSICKLGTWLAKS